MEESAVNDTGRAAGAVAGRMVDSIASFVIPLIGELQVVFKCMREEGEGEESRLPSLSGEREAESG